MPRNPNKIDYSQGLPPSYHSFTIIEDPRTGGHKLHHFGSVIFMVFTATLCGMNTFSDIEDFCELQQEWLKKWIPLPHGIPTAQTISNIFSLIIPDQFNQCLIAHLGTIHPKLQQQIIAIDGKKLRGSHGLTCEADHIVSAWAAQSGLTLAQTTVGDKTNEITAIPQILDMLDLTNQIITIDAMGTHTHIASQIIEKKADYILALKGNQGNLHKEAQDQFHQALRHLDITQSENWSQHYSVEKAHGRITERTTTINHKLDWLDEDIRGKWKNLTSLVRIETRNSKLGSEKETREIRYYISSLNSPAEEQAWHIRAHWGIENACHWV